MHKLVFLLLISFGLSAQSISKQVISPLGNSILNNNSQLSYTAGEVVIGGMVADDGGFQLGNGYYPSLELEALNIESATINLFVKIYPNPAKEVIFITHPENNFFTVFISDLSGKVILRKQVGKNEPINIVGYPSGTYVINVTTKDKKTNSYKIIKQ